MLLLVQIAAVAGVAFYLIRWRAAVSRRNAQSWDSLMARLRPDWSAHQLSDHFLWQEAPLLKTPGSAWKAQRACG